MTLGAFDASAPVNQTLGGRQRVIAALGIIQIVAWGSSYYLLAVLAGPITENTGWPYAWVIGGVSLGLLVAGLVSLRVGQAIDEFGGRPILAAAAMLLAAGLAMLAAAPSVPFYLGAWLVLGAGMGAGPTTPPSQRSGGSTDGRRAAPSPR